MIWFCNFKVVFIVCVLELLLVWIVESKVVWREFFLRVGIFLSDFMVCLFKVVDLLEIWIIDGVFVVGMFLELFLILVIESFLCFLEEEWKLEMYFLIVLVVFFRDLWFLKIFNFVVL